MAINGQLKAIFGKFTAGEISYQVYSQAKYYPSFVRIYIPDKPFDKLLPWMEASEKLVKSKPSNQNDVEDNLGRSVRRTRTLVKDYVLCNEFDLFVTFTFKADRQDITKSRAKMSNWLKNQQKRNGKFKYLIVPELHKDGALHFHGLLKNYPGKLNDSGLKTKNKQTVYNIKGYRSGFTTAVKIPPEDVKRVGNYVRKYVTKDMPLFFGKNRYWVSPGLNLPRTEDNPSDWYLKKIPTYIASNKFGTFMFFSQEAKRES